ncbi:hypothetical protein O988_06860 [Pseudogymnoascus sp. VKM F-3808]|nr:hypothetical protein O988_06860 [Pseudogymnoascus sp. VKM F-3808]
MWPIPSFPASPASKSSHRLPHCQSGAASRPPLVRAGINLTGLRTAFSREQIETPNPSTVVDPRGAETLCGMFQVVYPTSLGALVLACRENNLNSSNWMRLLRVVVSVELALTDSLSETTLSRYAYLNFFNPFYLSGVEPSCLDDASHSSSGALDFPKLHEGLSPFFSGSPFSSQTPESRYTALKSQVPHSGYSPTPCDRGIVFTTQDNWVHPINKAASAPLAIITSGLEAADFRTVIHHGQVTPGDSSEEGLSSPHKSVASATARRQPRKEKTIATATATAVASASSAMSKESSTGSQGGSETKVKKQRKPRRSSKKRTTAEQASAKRETLLKRNREAAYKCRLKKKTQTEEVIERVKVLGEDNAAKVVEVERLRRELEGLKGLLLPRYMGCGGERAVASLNGLCEVGVECGLVGTGIGMGTVADQDN